MISCSLFSLWQALLSALFMMQRSLALVARASRGVRTLAEYPGKSFNRGGFKRGADSGPATSGTGSLALLVV